MFLRSLTSAVVVFFFGFDETRRLPVASASTRHGRLSIVFRPIIATTHSPFRYLFRCYLVERMLLKTLFKNVAATTTKMKDKKVAIRMLPKIDSIMNHHHRHRHRHRQQQARAKITNECGGCEVALKLAVECKS